MPIHDWTRVTAGIFHDFHVAWIAEFRKKLNGGLLPNGYYALAERIASDFIPDVLTLRSVQGDPPILQSADHLGGALAVLTNPPKTSVMESIDEADCRAIMLASRQRYIAIKHSSGDRTVAMIEVVSPGNKIGEAAVRGFADKAATAFEQHIHLVVLDILPPTSAAPEGMHGASGK